MEDNGMSEEDAPPRPVPFYAWGETLGASRRLADERLTPPEEEAAPPVSAAPVERVENLSVEAEALSFVRAFLETSEQDITQKMDFLEQLGTLCEATTVEGFRFGPAHPGSRGPDPLDGFWEQPRVEDNSRNAREDLQCREGSVWLQTFLVALAATEFPVMGQLVGCMMLCRFDKNKMVAYCAARGLHHLYGFAARCRGKRILCHVGCLTSLERRPGGGVQPLWHQRSRWPWQRTQALAATEFPVMGQLVGCMTLCRFAKNKMVTYCAARGLHHLYGFAARCRAFLVALAATEFPVMGQLVGCMTLCRFDKNKMVAYCAARGLHHLYGFAARCRGKEAAHEPHCAEKGCTFPWRNVFQRGGM
ncbi:UNVERIFIED_CONTAM: hypothetical protein K2H54_015669 [Gekko kuhli]